jgi:hypothetical protein
MEKEQIEYFDTFEQNLQIEMLKLCTSHKMLDGVLLASEDIEERWKEYAPSYMADSVSQINTFPAAAIAWAGYIGMAVAQWWDIDWERYASEPYETLHGERGFDDMDEHIVRDILGIALDTPEAEKIEDMVRTTAEWAQSLIRKEGIEAQSVMAFHIFARTTKVMFEIGVSVQLRKMGYNYVKVNANVVS